MKIATIVGARPQFIKLAPLSNELRKHFKEIIIHTGQHYDFEMSKLFFEELYIPEPDYNFDIKTESVGEQFGEMLKNLEKVLVKERPELVVVLGDTNSTLAGALAAIQNHMPVAHVEAGPRNKNIDIPEMLNRLIVDNISSLLFCATKKNYQTLKDEGIAHNAYFVGDLMYDLFLQNLERVKKRSELLSKLQLRPNQYHVATCHRAENTDDKNKLELIIKGLIESNEKIVFPLHPRTKKMMIKFNLYQLIAQNKNIIDMPPLGYLDFLQLAYNANKIITDSGGVQREAYFLKKPCINIYDHTYWPEIEEDGWQVVTGINKEKIVHEIKEFLPKKTQSDIFGEGIAAKKIAEIIKKTDFSNIFEFKKNYVK